MQIENNTDFPHLARWQMRISAETQRKKTEREIIELFGDLDEDENEYDETE